VEWNESEGVVNIIFQSTISLLFFSNWIIKGVCSFSFNGL